MITTEAPKAAEDPIYWFTQCREEVLLGYQKALQAWPMWVLLHPSKEENEDVQTILLFDQENEDENEEEVIKQIVKDYRAYAIFSCFPGIDENEKVVLSFIEETLHFRRDQSYQLEVSNQEFSLGKEIDLQEPLSRFFFDRRKEDLC